MENNNIKLINIDNEKLYEKFSPLINTKAVYDRKEYMILGAIDEAKLLPVGICIASSDGAEVNIDYIYVHKDYRKKGVGTLLFEEIKDITFKSKLILGLTCSFDMNNDELFNFFYEMPDMSMEERGSAYQISSKDVTSSKRIQDLLTIETQMPTVVNPYTLELLCRQESDIRINDFADIDYDLSQAVLDNHKVIAALLVNNIDEENIEVAYLMCKAEGGKYLPVLMKNALNKYKKNCPEKNLKTYIINDEIDIYKFFPDAKPIDGICVARFI